MNSLQQHYCDKYNALQLEIALDIETTIKNSDWWREAQAVRDRHYHPSPDVMLADHLEQTLRNLTSILSPYNSLPFVAQLQSAMISAGLTPDWALPILAPVALLHDIGKTKEEERIEGKRPDSCEMDKMRHSGYSVIAAQEILPNSLVGREVILALIEEHDTPYAWFMQYIKSGQVPSSKSWARLDRKIDSRADGTGLILLCIFKLADIDGHEKVDDVRWFIEQTNDNHLRGKGKLLPVPDQAAIFSLVSLPSEVDGD